MLLKEIIEARDALRKLENQACSPKLSYTIMKILKETEDNEKFYIEKYRAIMDECAVKEDDGTFKVVDNMFTIKEDHKEQFEKMIKELTSLEVDDVSRKIKLSDLNDSIKICPSDMNRLDIFIAEE